MAEKTEERESTSTPHPSSLRCTQDPLKQPQDPTFSNFYSRPNGDFQMLPVMYPAALVPGLFHRDQEMINGGAGIYAVAVPPYMGRVAGVPSNTLIPLTYNIPTRRPNASEAAAESQENRPVGQGHGQQQPGPQRQVVVRRFHIAFQLDLLLILKLAAVIFLFNQDGSSQRLTLLVFLASLVYLYQTGALAPLIRWLSQGMHRAAAPPPPRPPVRAENVHPAARQEIVDAALAVVQEGLPRDENENRPAENGDPVAVEENGNVAERGGENVGNQWWGIAKEIQMIVFGFITSLLPGFHNVD